MNRIQLTLAALSLSVATLASANVVNQQQADFGVVSPLPYSRHFGDTFTAIVGSAGYTTVASSDGTVTYGSIDGSVINRPLVTVPGTANFNFYDDYVFTMPGEGGQLTASAVSVSFAQMFGIQNLQARLYAVTDNLTVGAPAGVVYAWTSLTDLTGATLSVSAFNAPVSLQAGTKYALEIRGLVFGQTASYGGNVNISPVPEIDALSLALAGLGAIGVMASRRRIG